ncbi:hypothetical protein [Pelagibacterium xiamenense]|uniref:hypothetical protein n=1 Tax=Pelagibacterium xiamenense TaxID=2901140 RepID=UPI001E5035E6|nr:hypothetical protein [Pelagibacterium xiamenense]MCD7058846.1 hypothetical protein [Pelagibacterium xiamenense]
MLSGPNAQKALDEALKDIRREEDEITQRIARATERMGKLRETELSQLRELAQVRLTEEARAELADSMSKAEAQAHEMLRAHGEAMEDLQTRLAEQDTALDALTEERGAVLKELSAKREEIEALKKALSVELSAEADYRRAVEAEDELEATAENALEKAVQAENDRAEKGAPYRADPLFMYLWERGYATPQYRDRGLTRMLDAWVARLVGYADARPNYFMLNEIPERLKAHAERLEADAAQAAQKREALEDAAIDAAGGKETREAVGALEARIEEIDAAIIAAEDAREALTAQHKQLAEGGDPKYEQAVGLLAQAISGMDVAQLLADARRTGTSRDDAIVTKLEDTRRRIAEDEAELREDRARLKTLETRRRELEDIAFEFKKSRYDDPRSRFGEDRLVGDLLNEFLRGAISASTYWGHWRKSQDWAGGSGPIVPPARSRKRRRSGGFTIPPGGFSPRPRSGGPWGSGSSSGGFTRPRSGGFGGGGFKTGGGFGGSGGGGFKTGGGF